MTAFHYECSIKEYHADRTAFSHSQIEDLIKSPRLFYGRHISEPPLFPKKQSKEFDVGTVCHECLTNFGGINAVVLEIPSCVLNKDGERKGAAWKEWDAAHPDIIKMKREELEPVYRMVESCRSTAPSWMWEASGLYEYSVKWTDKETNLTLRCRPDWIIERSGEFIVCDFKTTRSWTPRTFAADMAEFGYHRQAAWYIDGINALGMDVPAFMFIAIDKTPAHETRIYELDPNAIELGRKENRKALTELAYRLETYSWQTRDKGEIIVLDLPDWKYKNDPWSN